MSRLRSFWRSVFDVRPGEYLRTTCMTLYLMLVLFAYYILKPVSRAIFLNKFDLDKLPWLYILIAAVGGVLAYFYTRLAVNSSLRRAVDLATVFSIAVLVGFWWLIQLNIGWVVYAFNIWVSLFSIILVSQGWFIAANIFTAREAKRVYGILGVGSVIGAAFGGEFTARVVRIAGTNNLILASAAMVALSYIPFYVIARVKRDVISGAPGAEKEEDVHFSEILGNLRTNRHLQVIMAIMIVTFVIDVMVEFQFNAMAKLAYHNKTDLTAFLGNFYGFWLNLITFVCQFFLTGFVVSRFGVGGTLQIMPISIAVASIAALVSPSVLSTSAARLTEASTRYSFNKTGMELLYLPLPLELRNRCKAFVDVFVDRFARGLGGVILVLVTSVIAVPIRYVAVLVLVFSLAWIILSVYAKKEYIATVRKRLESRRLDLETGRVGFDDPATIQMLEQAVLSGNPRQAVYAIDVLGASEGFALDPLLKKVSALNPGPELRAKAYRLAARTGSRDLVDAANSDIRGARPSSNRELICSAVVYVMSVTSDLNALSMLLVNHPSPLVVEGALEYLAGHPESASQLISHDWLAAASNDSDPARRRLAALALKARGDQGTEALHKLLDDSEPSVAEAACQAAAATGNREYLIPLVRRLADPRLRGTAIEALAAFGGKIAGSLGDLLEDTSVPISIRRQIPRVLRLIPVQRSVDILLGALRNPDPAVRSTVLRALNRLRETNADLNYGPDSVQQQILDEARHYFQLAVSLEVFREQGTPHTPAALLVSTLEDRLKLTLERLFRLLGLKYPPRQIYAAYLALARGKHEDTSAAIEFLDNLLERDLKKYMLAILDDPGQAARRAGDLFGIRALDPETVIRELMTSGDEWLVACAIATAAQLGLTTLTPDIRNAAAGGSDISQVARDAMAVLA